MIQPKANYQESPQVDLIFEQTKAKKITWEFNELNEPSYAHWIINFSAKYKGGELFLEREHYLDQGGYTSVTESRLKIGKAEIITFYSCEDYVETISERGVAEVSALTMYVIDLFRDPLKLHWQIM